MELQTEMHTEAKTLIPVLIAGALVIVVFIVIFSARHRWDLNEQRYNELRAKENKP